LDLFNIQLDIFFHRFGKRVMSQKAIIIHPEKAVSICVFNQINRVVAFSARENNIIDTDNEAIII
jgi:hypothetical protein